MFVAMRGLLIYLLVVSPAFQITVGLNCTGDEDGGCQEVVCPGDSEPLSPEGGCKCVPARCHEPPPCPTGEKPFLKKQASLKPGDCCDVYECPPSAQEIDCNRVVCPEEENAEQCPGDSYKLPAVQRDGECCSQAQGCACLPAPCPVPACRHPSQLTVLAKGDGRPGSCCPMYQCTSHTGANRTCIVNGKAIDDGGKWSPNKCSLCRCDKGVVLCASVSECPPLTDDCEDAITPPDSCCPVCPEPSDKDNNIDGYKPRSCKSVNGTYFKHGTNWKLDDCTNCTCTDGKQECHASFCIHSCVNATIVKGECCPVCNDSVMVRVHQHCPPLDTCSLRCKDGYEKDDLGCILCQCKKGSNKMCAVDGKLIEDGGKWSPNKCSECRCDKGLILCASTSECPPLLDDCEDAITPPDSCCPLCPDSSEASDTSEKGKMKRCRYTNGVTYEHGESWQLDDCINCTCTNGKEECHAPFCFHNCAYPVVVEGQCCPVCNDTAILPFSENCPPLSSCSLKCKNGFVKDESDCFICQCKEDVCKLNCPDGYKRDSSGKEMCECSTPGKCLDMSACPRRCKHGYKVNAAGCEVCKCCKPLDNCNKICPHGFKVKSGCPVCNCQGASDVSNDLIDLHCNTESGERRDDGESWKDDCRQCYCSQGKEMCTLIVCPKIDCPEPLVFSKNSCCPTCPGSKSTSLGIGEGVCFGDNGSLKREGEEWSLGNCVKCRCLGAGKVVCNREPCPPAPCLHPIAPSSDSCCPYCPPIPPPYPNELGCGIGREAGMQWRESECKSCVCVNGVSTCYDENCDESPCGTPVIVKNQCCPVCADGWIKQGGGCRIRNITYAVGAEVDVEPCLRCTCIPGPDISCLSHCTKGEEVNFWRISFICLLGFLISTGLLCGVRICIQRYCRKRAGMKFNNQTYQLPPIKYTYQSVPPYDMKPPI